MADSILRLRVQSDEYDQKIKRAAEGIQQYAQKCHEAGGTLQYLDDGVLEFVQSLGEMSTVATNTKGQLRELTNALTDITATYRSLTDEEKASPFGQALAANIDILTERAGNAKDAMADVAASITNAASDTRLFDQMAQGMSVATAGFQGLTGAGKLLGIEMGNDVEIIAKLQAAMAVTNSLTTIQTALQKQSALMQGVQAAKTALQAVAQQAYAVATGEATVAQMAFNVAANANPYGLILGAIGLVVGAITAFVSIMGDSTNEVISAKAEMDNLTSSVDEAAEAYKRLADQTKNLGIGGSKEFKILQEGKINQINAVDKNLQDAKSTLSSITTKSGKKKDGVSDEDFQRAQELVAKFQKEKESLGKELRTMQEQDYDRLNRLMKYQKRDFSDLETQSEVENAISFLKNQMKYMNNTSSDYMQAASAKSYLEKVLLPQYSESSTTTTTPKKTPRPTHSAKTEKTEEQLNNEQIAKLVKEYQNLATSAKTADANTLEGITKREKAIQEEIELLQKRNEELKKFADEAKGVKNEVKAPEMTKGLSGLTDKTISAELSRKKQKLADTEFGSQDYNELNRNIINVETISNLLHESVKRGLDLSEIGLDTEGLLEMILGDEDMTEEAIMELIEKVNEKFEENPFRVNLDTGEVVTEGKKEKKEEKKEANLSKEIGNMANGFSGILSGLDSLGVEIPKGLSDVLGGIQSVVSVLTAISTIVSAIEAISAADALIPFANGGIVHAAGGYVVPGNKFSGDLIPAALSSGEMVLNRLQQGVLADALQGSAFGNMNLETEIRGESIRLVMNNNGRRTGKGEYVQSRKIS